MKTEKRRLPVLQTHEAPAAPSAPDEETPPPWHWVPLGALVTIVVAAAACWAVFLPYFERQRARLYGHPRSPEEFLRIHQHLSADALEGFHLRLLAVALPIALVSVAVGGLVVTRFGSGTNQRHGTLSGIAAMLLLVLLAEQTARSIAEIVALGVLIPFGGLVGYLGGVAGLILRVRSQSRG